jgi:hypothetical protein
MFLEKMRRVVNNKFSESVVEDAAPSWLDELGYAIVQAREIRP